MSERLDAARAYVARKPTDRFGLYALAMELRKAGDWEACFAAFERLLEHHPTDGAGWYHYGMAKRESGDRDGCRDVLTRGLEVTARSGDTHTHAEIRGALDDMELTD